MVLEIIISMILLVGGISVLFVIHICVVGRAFRDNSTNGTTHVLSRAGRAKSMKPEDINELPCFEYEVEQENGNEIGLECAVCLENFKAGEICRMLPKCTHSFHAECIDSWLLKTGACPVCRTGANQSPLFEKICGHSGEEA